MHTPRASANNRGPHKTPSILHPTSNILHPCIPTYSIYNMHLATCNIQHSTYNIQRAQNKLRLAYFPSPVAMKTTFTPHFTPHSIPMPILIVILDISSTRCPLAHLLPVILVTPQRYSHSKAHILHYVRYVHCSFLLHCSRHSYITYQITSVSISSCHFLHSSILSVHSCVRVYKCVPVSFQLVLAPNSSEIAKDDERVQSWHLHFCYFFSCAFRFSTA